MQSVLITTDTRYPVNRKVIRRAVEDTFKKYLTGELESEVSVAVVGSRKMRELSSRYLGDTSRHAVLAFALEDVGSVAGGFINPPDEVLRLGDVVLCWPQVLEEASSDGVMVDEQVYRLTAHGVEHLLGKHHEA